MANKILKTLTLPNAQGEPVTYELHPEWDNIEGKPNSFPVNWNDINDKPDSLGVGQFYEVDSIQTGEIFNDYDNNIASGQYSHAEGIETIALAEAQHVQGRYNIEDSADTYAHIVGNGTKEDGPSNAHTLDWHGNAWYAGSITATKLILGPESYGTSLPETGVEGQIFFLLGGSSGTATDDGNGIITLS